MPVYTESNAHSQAQSLPLKCDRLTCSTKPLGTQGVHYLCPLSKGLGIHFRACTKWCTNTIWGVVYACACNNLGMGLYIFPFYRTLQVLRHIIIKVYGELKLLKVLWSTKVIAPGPPNIYIHCLLQRQRSISTAQNLPVNSSLCTCSSWLGWQHLLTEKRI